MATLVAIACVVLVIGGVIWIVRRTSPPVAQFSSAAYMEDFRRRFPPVEDESKAAHTIALAPATPTRYTKQRSSDVTTNPYAVSYPNRDIPDMSSPLSPYSPLNPSSMLSIMAEPSPAPAISHHDTYAPSPSYCSHDGGYGGASYADSSPACSGGGGDY